MSLVQALNTKDFAVTAQLNLADVPSKAALIEIADIVGPAIDAIQLPENLQMHMSGIAAAAILLQQGTDPVVHLNCRDRNRFALQKDILGAVELGASSVVITRGKKLPEDKKLAARQVFDVPALEFMAYVRDLKLDDDSVVPSDLFIGAHAEIFDPDPDWTPKNLIRKCEAGANFVQTQVCFDVDIARNHMAKIVASKLTHKARFLLALAPLPSAQAAHWVKSNIKGALLPQSIIDRLESSDDPAKEGINICAELMREMADIPGISGVNLLSLGDPQLIPAAIAESGIR